MASQLSDFRTVFFESSVFSHTGMSQERWDLRAVFRNQQQVEVDWVHWQGRWPVVGRVWGLRYGSGLDKKMCQFCLSLVLHRPRRVSPSFLCCQGQDVRAQAGSTGAGSRHSSHLTWCHLSPQQWVQLLCPNPGVPFHTGPAPPPLWASSIRQRACLQQMMIQRLFACLSHKLTQHFSWRSTAGQPSARPMTSFLYSSISSSVNGDCHPYLVGLLWRLKNILHVKFSAQENNHIHTHTTKIFDSDIQ